MKENERKWKKVKENDRKKRTWKNMKEHERTWKNMKKWKKWKKWNKWNNWKNEKMKKWKQKKKWKWKKWKNENKTKKWRKIMKKRKKNEKKWIHTQNPWRFPGFTVVVVTFFVKIRDDFHDFVSECVSFPRKINNPFWEAIVFPKKSENFHLMWNKNTFYRRKSTKKKIAKVSPSDNNYSFRII